MESKLLERKILSALIDKMISLPELYIFFDKHLTPAINAMIEDPSHRWQLVELAEHVGLKKALFAKHFKSTLGISPLRWLMEYRMNLATELLRPNHLTNTQLASELGYRSTSAFYSAFKKIHGKSPRDYRQTSR